MLMLENGIYQNNRENLVPLVQFLVDYALALLLVSHANCIFEFHLGTVNATFFIF